MAGPRVERGRWGGSVASPSAATGWDGDRLLRGREAGGRRWMWVGERFGFSLASCSNVGR